MRLRIQGTINKIVRCWRPGAVLCAGLLAGAASGAGPKVPQPIARLELASVGFPGISQSFLDSGSSMLTVHFIDRDHLLVTYGLRGLVERIVGDPPEDEDRAVAGLVVELPAGKVVARTRWHLHDHGQYIWSVGAGRFLLRTSSTLTAIAPMANLAAGDAFRQMPFVRTTGEIDAVLVSPEGDMVTLETSKPRTRSEILRDVAEGRREARPELFSFIRVEGDGSPLAPVRAVSAGMVRASGLGLIPLNSRGYLFARSKGRGRWALEFDGFDGTTRSLSTLDSSCAPRLQFVSPTQFLVFSCRGSEDRIMLSALDFVPRETWEEPMGALSGAVHLAYAPQAGRFAFSRTVAGVSTTSSTATSGFGAGSASQEVRVYQTESGDLLAKLTCTPPLRTGQNFDLSSDGMRLLIVRAGVVEIYGLPELSKEDRKDLAELRQYEPPAPNGSRVELRQMVKEAEPMPPDSPEITAADAPAAASPPAAQSPPATAAQPANPLKEPAAATEQPSAAGALDKPDEHNGDDQAPRKPPTLLNPGEKTENGSSPPK